MRSRDAFTAIADPTRRRILDLLRGAGPLEAGEIASHFAAVSRPAISRHLRVLRECGVVTVERRGRKRRYSLSAEPLCRMRDGWLADFGAAQSESLRALRRRVDGA